MCACRSAHLLRASSSTSTLAVRISGSWERHAARIVMGARSSIPQRARRFARATLPMLLRMALEESEESLLPTLLAWRAISYQSNRSRLSIGWTLICWDWKVSSRLAGCLFVCSVADAFTRHSGSGFMGLGFGEASEFADASLTGTPIWQALAKSGDVASPLFTLRLGRPASSKGGKGLSAGGALTLGVVDSKQYTGPVT